MILKFTFFYGGVFSQWYKSPFVDENGEKYCTAEQYMMAQKAKLFGDNEMYDAIMRTNNPMEQKKLGRMVRNFNVKVWNEKAQDIVYKGNLLKFSQNETLKRYLLETGDSEIVEASPTDCIWGIGIGMQDNRRFYRNLWRGTNWLGIALMRVREEIKKEGLDKQESTSYS